jgi:hypothetical protein
MNTEEQSYKIERSFTESIIPTTAKKIIIKKKIETELTESIISNNQADTMNTEVNMNTEVKPLTKNQIAYQKRKEKEQASKAPAPALVVEESDAEDSEEESDDEPEPELALVVAEVEEDEETKLKRRLAEIQAVKKAEKVRENIGELRATLKTYQQGLIAKAEEEVVKLKQQLADVDTGAFDEELIAKALRKTPIKINADGEVVKKSAGVAGEGENRARAVRKLNEGNEKEKKMLSLFTKRVGEYRWGLHRGGTITALDKQGVFSMPLWKEQNATMVGDENTFKTIKEFKEWVGENAVFKPK